jgi:hypothetical protein
VSWSFDSRRSAVIKTSSSWGFGAPACGAASSASAKGMYAATARTIPSAGRSPLPFLSIPNLIDGADITPPYIDRIRQHVFFI